MEEEYENHKEAAKVWPLSSYKCQCGAILHIIPDSESDAMAGYDLACAACGDLYDLSDIRKRASKTG